MSCMTLASEHPATEPIERHGSFSSSSMWKLLTLDKSKQPFGAPGKKYIKQVQHEINLGRAISRETNAKPTSWGNFVERRAFDLLSTRYRLISKERYWHPDIKRWSGAPDCLSKVVVDDDCVSDVKCPVNLEVFCDKINALELLVAGHPELYIDEFPDDYYQLVSNSILTKAKYAEAIIYVPFKDELPEIVAAAGNFDGDQNSIAWLNWANENELPYLLRDHYYTNLNIFRFEVPQEDKVLLTRRVEMAVSMLQPPRTRIAA